MAIIDGISKRLIIIRTWIDSVIGKQQLHYFRVTVIAGIYNRFIVICTRVNSLIGVTWTW